MMMNAQQVLLKQPAFIKQPVRVWLIEDDQPNRNQAGIEFDPIMMTPVIEHLKQQLCSPDYPHQQRQAALRLAKIGPAAVDALVETLFQKQQTSQVLAAYALRKIGIPAVKPLLNVLDNCPTQVRQKLLWVLYTIGDRQVTDSLIACLKDPNQKTRRYAAWGLGLLRDPRSIPALVAALNDRTEKVQFDAGMALVKMGGKAVEALMETLYSGKTRARSQVATILTWLQDETAMDALIEALRDKDPHVRAQAALALGWIRRTKAVEPLINALYDDAPEVRMQAAAALGWIGDARAIEGLVRLLYDEDYWVPYSAADALGDLGDERAIAPLIRASHVLNPRVREAALAALQKLGYFNK